MQVEEHEQGRAGEDEQEDEQEDNAEVEQEAVADGAQRVVEEAHEVPAVRGVRDLGQPTREERARHDEGKFAVNLRHSSQMAPWFIKNERFT